MQLSILIVTFNQVRFIEQALRMAVAQQTTFRREIVVADDCSTDGTREIIERFVRAHPEHIRLVAHDRHVGVHQNFLDGYASCDGRYLALLAGDDYWISPHKLQRQINFLDRHAECAVCFHNVLTVHDDGTPETLACPPERKEFSGVEDLLIENFIPASSAVYRHGLVKEFPEWSRTLKTWDWVLNLFHAQFGRVGYLSDTMGVARSHEAGLWTGASSSARVSDTVAMLGHFNKHFGGKYDAVIRASIQHWRSVGQLEQLHATFKQLEGEWQRQLEMVQLDRSAAVNELRMQLREAHRDQEHLTVALERATREKGLIMAEKELALREMSELRQQAEYQRLTLVELRTAIESSATREASIGSETLRGLSSVDQQLGQIYRWMDVHRTRELVHTVVPPGATVLIVSKGDAEFLQLDGRTAWHFPQTQDGTYAGSHPGSSAEALEHLEQLRSQGAAYLAFPGSSLWWLSHYSDFTSYLEQRYRVVLNREGACVIFALDDASDAGHARPEQGVGAAV